MVLLSNRIGAYDCTAQLTFGGDSELTKANTVAAVKALAEGSGILDAAAYPANMTVCSIALVPWLQKAIAAREAAVAFNAENKVKLE